METIERQTEKLHYCLYTLNNLFLLYKIKLRGKLSLLTALTPQTTVVFPSFTKADPSAVDIEPGKIKLYANLSMKLMQNKNQFFKFYFYFFMFLFYLTNI